MTFSSIRQSRFSKSICFSLIITFVVTMVITPRASYAQGGVLGLPQPGTMVNLSTAYVPLMITGLSIHPENPLLMDFIVSTGNSGMNATQVKKESDRLIKYFLACLTIPENNQWVNLSPYEKQRIIPEDLGQTVLGQDMLAQDYLLKQLTASLIYPEKNLGRNFWDKVYARARQEYGTTQIPVNTFNKVWILPEYAKVFEHKDTVLVIKSHLKVMLDEDYLSLQKHMNNSPSFVKEGARGSSTGINNLGSQLVRSIILPAIEQEVNHGRNFAQMRQIYNSMILAVWFKNNLKQALLNQVYADKSKVNGVNVDDPAIKEKIYKQYLEAYKKGVFNYIKEEPADVSLRGGGADEAISKGTTIARKYFSGGLIGPSKAMITIETEAQPGDEQGLQGDTYRVEGGVRNATRIPAAAAMINIPELVRRIYPTLVQLASKAKTTPVDYMENYIHTGHAEEAGPFRFVELEKLFESNRIDYMDPELLNQILIEIGKIKTAKSNAPELAAKAMTADVQRMLAHFKVSDIDQLRQTIEQVVSRNDSVVVNALYQFMDNVNFYALQDDGLLPWKDMLYQYRAQNNTLEQWRYVDPITGEKIVKVFCDMEGTALNPDPKQKLNELIIARRPDLEALFKKNFALKDKLDKPKEEGGITKEEFRKIIKNMLGEHISPEDLQAATKSPTIIPRFFEILKVIKETTGVDHLDLVFVTGSYTQQVRGYWESEAFKEAVKSSGLKIQVVDSRTDTIEFKTGDRNIIKGPLNIHGIAEPMLVKDGFVPNDAIYIGDKEEQSEGADNKMQNRLEKRGITFFSVDVPRDDEKISGSLRDKMYGSKAMMTNNQSVTGVRQQATNSVLATLLQVSPDEAKVNGGPEVKQVTEGVATRIEVPLVKRGWKLIADSSKQKPGSILIELRINAITEKSGRFSDKLFIKLMLAGDMVPVLESLGVIVNKAMLAEEENIIDPEVTRAVRLRYLDFILRQSPITNSKVVGSLIDNAIDVDNLQNIESQKTSLEILFRLLAYQKIDPKTLHRAMGWRDDGPRWEGLRNIPNDEVNDAKYPGEIVTRVVAGIPQIVTTRWGMAHAILDKIRSTRDIGFDIEAGDIKYRLEKVIGKQKPKFGQRNVSHKKFRSHAMMVLPQNERQTIEQWAAEKNWDNTVVKNVVDWYSSNAVNDEQRQALLRIINQSKADKIVAGFSSEKGVLQPGTAGTRERMENLEEDKIGPNFFSPTTVIQYTWSFVNWYKTTQQTGPAFIAKEVRENSDIFGDIAAKILLANGIPVIRVNKPVSTPFTSFLAKWLGKSSKYGKPAFGYQISASHNKFEDNGIKFMGPDGQQFMPDVMNPIAAGIPSLSAVGQLPEVDLLSNPDYHILTDEEFSQALNAYFDEIDSTVTPEIKTLVQVLIEKGKKFVFTPLNGASGDETIAYLKRIGLEAGENYLIPPQEMLLPTQLPAGIYAQKKIANSDPARPGVLDSTQQYADEQGIDMVMARDPDGDRLVFSMKIDGVWKKLDGNQNSIVMLHDRLSHSEDLDKSRMLFMRSHATTMLLDKIAAAFGVKTVVVPVGFKYFGAKIIQVFNSVVGRYFFGAEESYGTSNGHINEKDGLSGLANMLIIIARQEQVGKNVFDYLNDIYMKFGYPGDLPINVPLPGATKPEHDKARNNVKAALAKLKVGSSFGEFEIVSFKDKVDVEGFGQFHDGYDFILKDKSGKEFRLLFRPSGTEPLFKAYFSWQDPITSNSPEQLQQIISQTNGFVDNVKAKLNDAFKVMAGSNAMLVNTKYVDDSNDEWSPESVANVTVSTQGRVFNPESGQWEASTRTATSGPGGIDLNSRSLNLESSGEKVNITFDPAVIAQFRRGDFSGVRIQILDVVPINLMPLLGLKEDELPGQLAKA